MDTQQIVILVVVVLAVLALLAALVLASRKKKARETEARRHQAAELRHQAGTRAPEVHDTKLAAAEADAEAELLRVKAERAERDAADVKRSAVTEQARHEDTVREADRLDPDVDHRSDDYRPTTDLTDLSDRVDPRRDGDHVDDGHGDSTGGAHRGSAG